MYKYRHQRSIQVWLILSSSSWYQLPFDPILPHPLPPFPTAAPMTHSPVHTDTSSSDDEAPLVPATTSTIQTITIRNHVPVVLDLDQSNYGQWRCLFDSVFGKFGLRDMHIRAPPLVAQRDADWHMSDWCIVNWLHTTIAKPVFDIIYKPHDDVHHLGRHEILTSYRMAAPTRLFMSSLSMTLLVADTTSVLDLVLVKLPDTVNIPIVPTCLVHLIA
jgi:hypothetical protein